MKTINTSIKPNDYAKHTKSSVRYLTEIAKFKPLTREEEIRLFVEIPQNRQAVEKVYKHNLLFVVAVTKRYNYLTNATLTLEDLINEGNIGLMTAIQRFDPKTGNKFISYAVWWITSHILTAIQRNIKTIRIPSNVKKFYDMVRREESLLEQSLNRTPDVNEIFESLASKGRLNPADNIEKIRRTLTATQFESSLNAQISNDYEGHLEKIDVIVSDEASPMDVIVKKEIVNLVDKMLEDFPRYIREYIYDYFGLHNRIQLSIPNISKKYGESEAYIRKNITLYLRKLKSTYGKNKRFYNTMIGVA